MTPFQDALQAWTWLCYYRYSLRPTRIKDHVGRLHRALIQEDLENREQTLDPEWFLNKIEN